MSGTNVSLTGIAAATGIVVWFTMHWWIREGHKPKKLLSFLLALAFGILSVLAAAGSASALGIAVDLANWTNSVSGYAGLVWGVNGSDMSINAAHSIVLTSGGYVILFLCTVVLAALVKFSKVAKAKVIGGFVAGCGLGLCGTVAGAAAVPLASAANMLGAGFTGMFT